jgi:hypothetical protein
MRRLAKTSAYLLRYMKAFAKIWFHRYVVESITNHLVDEDVGTFDYGS